jgi:hypothetical protein
LPHAAFVVPSASAAVATLSAWLAGESVDMAGSWDRRAVDC